MSNWQNDLDRKIQARKEAEARRKATEEARRRREREEKHAQEKERWLQWHKRRYNCHICGDPSDGPAPVGYWTGGEDSGTYKHSIFRSSWFKPISLQKCSVCGKWACFKREHIHKGICQKCAQKGYMPGDQPTGWEWLSSKIQGLRPEFGMFYPKNAPEEKLD